MVTKEKSVEIPAMKIDFAEFNIVGTTALIVHKFGSKAIQQIVEKQAKKSKVREERNPEKEMDDCLHKFSDGRTGFPANGFKAAMVRAGKMLEWKMTDLRQLFFIEGDDESKELVEIIGNYELRTDMIRVANGAPDIRYRPEYKTWRAKLTIRYNSAKISAEQLAQLIDAAGFGVGIGEWRPERSGNFGMFQLMK